MIEILPAMPSGVTGIRVSGRVSGDDLREFEPTMKELRHAGEIRIVEVIADDYEGFGPGGLGRTSNWGSGSCSTSTRRSSESQSCRIRSGLPTRCTRSHGWFPVNSRYSALTNSTPPLTGPRADSHTGSTNGSTCGQDLTKLGC